MKPICVPKLRPSRIWEKNFSGWQDVQRLRSCIRSWIFCGRIPPCSRRTLRMKIFQKIASSFYQKPKQYEISSDIGIKEFWKDMLRTMQLLFSYRTWTSQERIDFITICHLHSYINYRIFLIIL